MKTLIAILFVCSFQLSGFARNWQTYNLNKEVSVESPEVKIEKVDGLNSHKSQVGSAILVFFVTPDNVRFDIKDKKDLDRNYQDTDAGMLDGLKMRGCHPEKISSDSILFGNILGRRTVIRFTEAQNDIIAEFRYFFLDGKMYQFQYSDFQSNYDPSNADLTRFFESVKISGNPGFERQITKGKANKPLAYRAGYLTGYVITFGAIILGITAVIVTVVILIVRRKKKAL